MSYICGKCLNVYSSPLGLNKHKCNPKKTRNVKMSCVTCKQVFGSEDKLENHKCQRAFKVVKEKPPEFVCEFCNKGYETEGRYLKHRCKYRSRLNFKSELYFRIAFNAYIKFHQKFQYRCTAKSEIDFIKSKYYDGFIKFGKYAIGVGMTRVDEYISFLLKYDVGLDDWTKDEIYELYVVERMKTENAYDAIQRSMKTAEKWAEKNHQKIGDYFRLAGTHTIISNIRTGRVSPWFLYNSKSGKDFIRKLDQKQLDSLQPTIDPVFWGKQFKSVDYMSDIKTVLKGIGF